jgi:predicted DNA-binding transcriptional regulator AlpA
MTLTEEVMQAVFTAPDERKRDALRVLRGETVGVREQDAERFLTQKECARRLGVSACSLWRWQVPRHVLGGRPRFRLSEIEKYLASDEFKRRAAVVREADRERRARVQSRVR